MNKIRGQKYYNNLPLLLILLLCCRLLLSNQSKMGRQRLTNILKKYWFLIGLLFCIVLADIVPDLGATGGKYTSSSFLLKNNCIM